MNRTVSDQPKCQGCPLRQLFPSAEFVPPIPGTGLRLAIGETGEGLHKNKMVEGWYKKIGVNPSSVTIANVIQCCPKKFPTDKDARAFISENDAYRAVEHCKQVHLKPLLESRPWKRVDLFGEKALRFLTGKSEGIAKWRGSPLTISELSDKPIAIGTLHPGHIMKQQILFPIVLGDLSKSLEIPPEKYNLFPTLDDVKKFTATEFAFDIETSRSAWGQKKEIYMVGLSAKLHEVIVVPFNGAYIEELKRIFANAKTLIGQNILQFDMPVLKDAGLEPSPECDIQDILLLHHLRFPDFSGGTDDKKGKNNIAGHDLEFIASQFSSKPAWKHEKAEFQLYCARDTDVTLESYYALKQLCEQAGLTDLYSLVQVPLAKICQLMKETGCKLDSNKLSEVRKRIQAEIEEEEKHLPKNLSTVQVEKRKRLKAPDGTVNDKGKPIKYVYKPYLKAESPWRKPVVVKNLLYKEWGLPVQYHPTKKTVSIDKTALDKLIRRTKSPNGEFYNPERAEIIRLIKSLKKKAHLLSGFLKEETEKNKVEHIHPSFSVHGTASHRLSSSGEAGNLQNQPLIARYLYVPENGWEMAEADFSQVENRLTAYLAEDVERLQRYINDPDFSEHKFAASMFFDIPYEEVEKDNDRDTPYGKAKPIVHGSNYGMGAQKIADTYDLALKETKDLLYKWKSAIGKTVSWQDDTSKLAKRQGFLTTPFGRKRWFYTADYHTKALAFIPSCTAADIIYRAMIGLMYERINWPKEKARQAVKYLEPLPQPAKLHLQVHDSLLFSYPKEMRTQVLGTIKRVMEQPFTGLNDFSIPIGISVGDSWGDCKPIKISL